jgi:hypothetical protein
MGRWMWMCSVALLPLLPGVALDAKEGPSLPGAALLALAESKAKAGELTEAGALVAQAVVATVKAKSLAGEQRAAEVLDALLDEIEGDASRDARGDAARDPRPGRWKARELVAAVHKGLDAKRRGLFVSAPALALGILLDAMVFGDATHLAPAVATLTEAGAAPKAGVAAASFAKLAQGVAAAREGKAEDALAALAAAGAELEGRGFTLPGLFARLEQAAVLRGAGREPEAFDVLGKALEALPKEPDLPSVQEWLHGVEVRMEKASPEALTKFRERGQAFLGSSPGGAGGAGGRGGHGGGAHDVSPIGKVLPKWGASKPFVTATRTAEGLACTLTFDPTDSATVAPKPGQTSWEAGGVTLFVAWPAVALCMVDVAGTAGQPGERSRASRARAWVWLAVGETYAASQSGVEVTGKAAPLTARTGR